MINGFQHEVCQIISKLGRYTKDKRRIAHDIHDIYIHIIRSNFWPFKPINIEKSVIIIE